MATERGAAKRPAGRKAQTENEARAAATQPLKATAARATVDRSAAPERVEVRRTYKLYIGGAFPRSESQRSYPVTDSRGRLLAHAAQASRKDIRDAVKAARGAFAGWSSATAYNRGQVLYRVAEMLEGRREQFADEVGVAEGLRVPAARAVVEAAIDRWVWYAGWTDKYAQVAGSTNPVAGPYFNFSLPDPSGVVGAIAPEDSSLLGLVSVLAPIIATGNTVVVVASPTRPLPAITLGEVLATSDLPGGVVNILTGEVAELAPWLASHRDVNCLDLTGVPLADRPALAETAADTVKRVYSPGPADWSATPGLSRLGAFVETKTVWHPVGV